MSKRHTQIILADARAGMTLSDPILDTKGNLLLPEGTLLTGAILESLRRHQIDTLAVAGAEISDAEENAERQNRLARVEKLFRQPGTAANTASDTTRGVALQTAATEAQATEILYQYIRDFRAGAAS
ncbi:MAG: hypothetical protein V4695_12745 [Pseudomonadota bacterium]